MSPADAPVRSDSFRPVLGATVLLVLVLLAIAALKSSRDLEAARDRERLLQQRIAETRTRSERLRVRIDRLRHDPGMLERLAREDLGMVRPGDVIIELPAGPADQPRRPPKPQRPGETPQPIPADAPQTLDGGASLTPAAGSDGPPPSPPPPAPGPPAAAPPTRG
ncbi:MAG TPA: septum formation initiator family protein [Thermoanaerobaculia bacterium]